MPLQLSLKGLRDRVDIRRGSHILPSLRLWLQSTSLLAVLAGYTLLLALNQGVASFQRLKFHRELVTHLLHSKPPPLLRSGVLPGLVVLRLPGLKREEPVLLSIKGELWLVSTTPIPLTGFQNQSLRVEQNVSASVQRERIALLLLVAAAGASVLLTSVLLRLVLQRGLVQPLDELAEQLDAMAPPPAPVRLLNEERQPSELVPIATSFNALQLRLANSWEQQRSFVNGVAHELRTPLTLIMGHAQSLQRQAVLSASLDGAKSLQLIDSEARRMALLVSDLLDLARRDAGRLELRLQPVSVEDVLLECFERLVSSSNGRLKLLVSDSNMLLPLALADSDRLQQCLVALIDNALRYSPEPKTVELSAEASADQLVIHVRDHGPGVLGAERNMIFERFVRGSAAADIRGSGLGLSIVRSLVEAMGGAVEVADAQGGGADFRLSLRLA